MNQSLCIIAILTAAALAGCSTADTDAPVRAAAQPDPLLVTTGVTKTIHVPRTISVTGSLEPDETVTVSNEVAGRLVAIHADFGQRVKKGQVLAVLDRRELNLQRDRARAALAQALARIGLTPDQADIEPGTTPGIRQARAQLETARTRYESAAKLVRTGDIAQERFVELEKNYNAAQAAVDGAIHELRVVLASVRSLKAEAALAEKHLDDCVIRAPFDGSISVRSATAGQYLRQNTPIVTIVKSCPLRLRVDVPETAAAAVRVGTRLRFSTDAFPGRSFEAIVREVNPSLNSQSRTLSAEGRLRASGRGLRPGMFVRVLLTVQRDANALMVPKEAVRTVAGLNKIFTIEDGRAAEHKVVLGREMDGWVEVRQSALRSGAIVATSNLVQLTDGAEVRIETSRRPPATGQEQPEA